MFTGLIADVGSVTALERADAGATLRIRTRLADELSEGDSIAVNGVCLTAISVGEGAFQAQAMSETLTRSSLGALRAQGQVNLELPLRVQDRLGGHVVLGHVDGTGTVRAIRDEGFARVLEIEVEPSLRRYLVEKGSVAVDGVSLTVSAVGGGRDGEPPWFEVSLIPATLSGTTLGRAQPGSGVNLEVDVIGKYVERLLAGQEPAVRP